MPVPTVVPQEFFIPVEDAYEETMDLASACSGRSRSLGMHSPTAASVTLEIPPFTLTVQQSPTLLNAKLASGTTGAVLWNLTPRFARWLVSSPHARALIPETAKVLELGCGATSVLAATLGRTVAGYIQSDMGYTLKLAAANLEENLKENGTGDSSRKKGGKGKKGPVGSSSSSQLGVNRGESIKSIVLDWQEDDLASHPEIKALAGEDGLTAVIACDCVYNEVLVPPFLDTLEAAARLGNGNAIVMVATEIRSPDVQEIFLEGFMKRFEVYRVNDRYLGDELKVEDGIVIHVGVLRD
ncbi:hypothetical protein BZA77DRAFT_311139 [Pyronema omphalodes]|nr:hypothetical protein BZA77DRAFT_311139 [Pyronema omphalodes]